MSKKREEKKPELRYNAGVVGCTRECTNASDGQDLFIRHCDLVNGPYKLILILNEKEKYTQLAFASSSEDAGPTALNKKCR